MRTSRGLVISTRQPPGQSAVALTLWHLRKERDWSAATLARRAGVGVSTIARIETEQKNAKTGKVDVPKASTLSKIAAALGEGSAQRTLDARRALYSAAGYQAGDHESQEPLDEAHEPPERIMPKLTPPCTDLGREIRAAREQLRYSQDALGGLLHVKGTVISRWETGVSVPSAARLARLAQLASPPGHERDALYGRWANLLGQRHTSAEEQEPPGSLVRRPVVAPPTVEGAMARAMIDEIHDPGTRLRLVLLIRAWISAPALSDDPGNPEPASSNGASATAT